MERVGVLIDKLQEQLTQKADVQNMLITAQLLQKELLMQANGYNLNSPVKASVSVPNAIGLSTREAFDGEKYKPVPKPESEPEPIQEPITQPNLPETEPSPKPEPEPIPHFVEQKPLQELFPAKAEKSRWALDPMLEVPTLAHQKVVFELNDVMVNGENSINDKLKENRIEMGSKLQDVPVRDLKKAVSVNDRHQFIQELFRGDETMYERSIKTINSFHFRQKLYHKKQRLFAWL
jgi:hypothetical protein